MHFATIGFGDDGRSCTAEGDGADPLPSLGIRIRERLRREIVSAMSAAAGRK